MQKLLVIIVMLLLFMVSLTPPALAQGAASGESIAAFQRGQAPVTPGTKVPGLSTPRVSYWALAGLGRDPLALGKQPPAVTDAGMPYNPFSVYGPYGIFDQYGMYGPYGMYGQGGPGYGSGYGFNGFGLHDEWELVKVHNEQNAAQAAAEQQALTTPKGGTNATKPTNVTGTAGNITRPVNLTSHAGTNTTRPVFGTPANVTAPANKMLSVARE